MTPIFKHPDSGLRYAIPWPASLIDGASITTASWSIVPDEPGGLAVSGDYIDGGETGGRFAGGIAGHVYRASCHIDLSDGRAGDRSLLIRIDDR